MSQLLDELRETLRERYVVESEIGRGGMATVFAAEDLKHGRRVAIKVLSPELSSSIDADRFKREIQIAARLSHPHILPVFDSDVIGNVVFYTMPFVEGESLRDRLRRETRLGIDDAVTITCEVADALAYAHSLGVIHRDIKPENILLHGGHAVVADFGIAHILQDSNGERLTRTGTSIGTAAYMSPEQFAGTQVDGRSDMYSLACVLYEMLVGEVPFTGPDAMAIMARHTMEAVPSIRVVRSNVSDQVEDVIMRALEKVPSDRFPTVTQFKDALLGGLATGTFARYPSTRLTSRTAARAAAVASVSRRRKIMYGAAALLCLASAGAAAGYYRAKRHRAAQSTGGEVDSRHLAVLYLDDQSPDSSLRNIATGLTESLIHQLEQVDGLQVVSAAGVAPFAHSSVRDDSVARVLHVGTLVRGSIEPRGNELSVSVNLVDGLSGADVGQRANFRVARGQFLTARDSLAHAVADILRQRLGDEVRLNQLRRGTDNAEAWELVQRAENVRRDGERLVRSGDPTGGIQRLVQADSIAAAAARLDTKWPEPLIEQGTIAFQLARLSKDQNAIATGLQSALTDAAHALALDQRDAAALELRATADYARVQRGLVPDDHTIEGIVDGAERDLRDAVTIEPRRASAWYALSIVEYGKKNVPDAYNAARRAYETDAYLRAAPDILVRLWATTYDLEQFPDAIRWCNEGQRRFPTDPRFVRCRMYLMLTKAVPPNPDDAWKALADLQRLTPKQDWPYASHEAEILVSIVLARTQQSDSAHHVLAQTSAGTDIDPRGELMGLQALAYTFFGEPDKAVDLLQEYLTTHPDHRAGFAKVNQWWWRDLQQNPRFKTLAASGR
jgi:serine/threonine-protein kinase